MSQKNPTYLDLAWERFDPLVPIPAEDSHDWYVNLDAARGPDALVPQVVRRISRGTESSSRVLVLGHRGAGKSTELQRIRGALEREGFRCAVVQTDRDLDRKDVDIVEVQVLLVDEVSKVLHERSLEPSPALMSRLRGWFVEEVIETTKSSSASAGWGLGELLNQSLPNLKADLKVNVERRKILREKVSHNLREFVDVVSELVGEANGLLQVDDCKGLVLLIDGLEKAADTAEGLKRVATMLFDQSEQWGSLPAPLVITAPLGLLTESDRIDNHFDKFYLVPSVPVAPRPDHPDATQEYVVTGRRLLRKVVSKRLDIDKAFANPADLDRLIDQSGGGLRDLFRLIRDAIDAAPPEGPISTQAVTQALRSNRLQRELIVQPKDLEPLRSLLQDAESLHYDAEGIRLLQTELALHYVNGGNWFGVHPAVLERVKVKR
jgi:energy-coupling factor transporter ATP-binding protein EcfA2